MSERRAEALATVIAATHVPLLDGLRAVAVTAVVVFHAGVPIPGDMGVTIFFVLSGFLITLLLLREIDETGTVSLTGFYGRRTVRIFPAYYAFLIASMAYAAWRHAPWPGMLIFAAFGYWMNYYDNVGDHPTSSVAHAWSLAVEEHFYLLWPPAFRWLSRRGGRPALRAALAIVIAAVFLWRSYLTLIRRIDLGYVYGATETRLDSLAIGCLLAVAATSGSLDRAARAAGRWPWLPLLTVATLAALHALPRTYAFSAGFTVDSLLIALLMVQLLVWRASPWWRWLDARPVRYVGTVSYPMYLWHGWVITTTRHLTALPHGARIVIAYGLTMLVASGSWILLERPLLRLRRRVALRSALQSAS